MNVCIFMFSGEVVVTKFTKFVVLCGGLSLFICCMMLCGCRKTQQQGGVPGETTAVMDDDADLSLEIETHGTVKASDSTVKKTKQSTVKSSDSTVEKTKQSTVKTTNSTAKSTKKSTVETTDSTASKEDPVSSKDDIQSSNAATVSTAVTTTRTTQKDWTPDLGKKPK